MTNTVFDPFPCTACGACCMGVAHVPDLQQRGWVLPNGTCLHYDRKTRKCAIYADRPTVCRVSECKPPLMSPESWRALNLACCDWMHQVVYEVPRETTGTCTHEKKGTIVQVLGPDGRVVSEPALPDLEFDEEEPNAAADKPDPA